MATWANCTAMEAQQLGETDLDVYNDFLFIQTAKDVAEPLRYAVEEEKRKRKKAHEDAAKGNMEPGKK